MKKLYSLLFCALILLPFKSINAQLINNIDGFTPMVESDDAWPFEIAQGIARDMIVFDDTLYIVGTFQEFNGMDLNGVFKWDGDHIHTANAPFNFSAVPFPSTEGVHCISIFQNHLVIGVKQSNQLANVYSLENNEWMPIGNSLGDIIIRDLIEWNDQLYVTSEGDSPLMVLGDENTWIPVAVPFTGTINDLEVYNGDLYCNSITNEVGKLWKNNGSEFVPVFTELQTENTRSITVTEDELYALGLFNYGEGLTRIINISSSEYNYISVANQEITGYKHLDENNYFFIKTAFGSFIQDDQFISHARYNSVFINTLEYNPTITTYKGAIYFPTAYQFQNLDIDPIFTVGIFKPGIRTTISRENQYFTKKGSVGIVNNHMNNFQFSDINATYNPNLMNGVPLYASGFLLSGNVGEQRRANAYVSFEGLNNWFPGPYAENYTIQTLKKYNRAWKVTQEEIENHISSWNSPGYEIPTSILEWPGNGDAANGESHMLAPFHDENQNSWYEPQLGDHPLIRGVAATFWIEHAKETPSLSLPLQVEKHTLAYLEEEGVLNDLTLFFHTTIVNRSNDTYDSLRMGLFNDFDLGNYMDDLIGCDSLLSVAYVYNGDDSDEPGNGYLNYGEQIPAFSAVFLSESMEANTYYNVGSNPINGDPENTNDLYNYMQGKYKTGEYAINTISNYPTGPMMFQDSPCGMGTENEIALGNPAGDRRLISAGELHTLLPNESLCFDFAYYFKPASGDNIETLCAMLEDIPAIHTFYENQNYGCSYINSIDENEEPKNWSVFPNPTSDIVTLQIEGMNHHTKVEIKVLDMQGREVMHSSPTSDGGNVILDLSNLSVGSYFITARVEEKIYTKLVTRE